MATVPWAMPDTPRSHGPAQEGARGLGVRAVHHPFTRIGTVGGWVRRGGDATLDCKGNGFSMPYRYRYQSSTHQGRRGVRRPFPYTSHSTPYAPPPRCHNPCDGIRSARLNLLDEFSQAMTIVNSTIASSS